MNKLLIKLSLFIMLIASSAISAHHSRTVYFDQTKLVEVEGEITRVLWRHPHIRYWVQADEAYGGALWELESTPPSILEREGITQDLMQVGARVRAAGAPARRTENAMEVSHILLPDGREVLLYGGLEPIWSEQTVERSLLGFSEQEIRLAEEKADGIFRVWSREGGIRNRTPFWLDTYPLTASAQAIAATWDEQANAFTGCISKVMPGIMNNIWPFEFIGDSESDQIQLRIEEFDQIRTIYIRNGPGAIAASALGYSVGYWENDDLIVTTSDIRADYFGTAGIQLSGNEEIIERFSLSNNENRLDYTMTVTDPQTFTEPVVQNSNWIWRPGEMIKPYDCVEVPESWTTAEQ